MIKLLRNKKFGHHVYAKSSWIDLKKFSANLWFSNFFRNDGEAGCNKVMVGKGYVTWPFACLAASLWWGGRSESKDGFSDTPSV